MDFDSSEAIEKALLLNGATLADRQIKVNQAKSSAPPVVCAAMHAIGVTIIARYPPPTQARSVGKDQDDALRRIAEMQALVAEKLSSSRSTTM